MKREELEKVKLDKEEIADIYEMHINKGLDFVDSVEINEDGSFNIYYFFDGEDSTAKYSSLKEFLEAAEKYGDFEE